MQPVWLFASLPLIASAFGFGRVTAKLDDDGFFIGFPSYWNIVVYYMWQLQSSVLINTIALLILSAMVFIPSRYVYPTRYPKAQWLHLIGARSSLHSCADLLWDRLVRHGGRYVDVTVH
jgi:phosphatidylcholine synthase